MTDHAMSAAFTQTDTRTCDHLVHIGDVHFWRIVFNPLRMLNKRFLGNLTVIMRRRREFILENTESFMDAVAATGARTALLTGDLVSTATPEEFRLALDFVDGLRSRGMNVLLTPGNHDVYTFESVKRGRFEQFFADHLPQEGFPCVRTLAGGTPVILAHSVVPRHFSARGHITKDTVERVRDMLKDCDRPTLFATHYPYLHRTYGYKSNPFRRMANARLLVAALRECPAPLLYASGHVHRFSLVHDPTNPSLLQLTTGGFLHKNRHSGADGEFTEILVNKDGFNVFRHRRIREQWRRDLIEPEIPDPDTTRV
jgi:hypothetical protein